VERISLGVETVRENREVSDTVRREEIEIDDGAESVLIPRGVVAGRRPAETAP
jgi:stress response protein YsnF